MATAYTPEDIGRWARDGELPPWVKAAALGETVAPEILPAGAYADPDRTMPCHTPAATWCSAKALTDKRASLSPRDVEAIEHYLKEAARWWGILPDVDAALAPPSAIKEASADPDDFALVREFVDGTVRRALPVRDASEIKAASDWLWANRDALPYADRHAAAKRVLAKAAALGADPGRREFLERQAGLGGFDPTALADVLQSRRHLAEVDGDGLTKLADDVRDHPYKYVSASARVDLVTAMDGFDRSVGLPGRYCDTYPRPEDVAFAVTPKAAEDLRDDLAWDALGRGWVKADLAKVAVAELDALFGPEFVLKVASGLERRIDGEKLAGELAGLTESEAAALGDALAGAGVTPATSTAAGGVNGSAEWGALAEAYAAWK